MMASSDSIEQLNDKNRVKVFELDDNSSWVDKGTGHVSVVYVQAKSAFCIVVQSEADGTVVMNTRVSKDELYSCQKDTLIVWAEPSGTDLALSFQESEGRDQLWEQLSEVRKRMAADKHDIDQLPLNTDDMFPDDLVPENVLLPDPQMGNLNELYATLSMAARNEQVRDQVIRIMNEKGFLSKLLPILELCEEFGTADDLFTLSMIMRQVIFLNDNNIYEYVLRDDVFPIIVGMLEYDKEYPHLKASHRDHFKSFFQPKMVLPISNPVILLKINQTYRAQYLKDVALARVLDDSTFSALNAIAYFNYIDILTYFQQDPDFLPTLLSLLRNPETLFEKQKEIVAFLNELTTASRQLQKQSRSLFYTALLSHGLFSSFEFTLANQDIGIRISALAILHSILEHDPTRVREYCRSQVSVDPSSPTLMDAIIDRCLDETDAGLKSQAMDLLRALLDTTGLTNTDANVFGQDGRIGDVDEFLKLFYNDPNSSASRLLKPILSLDPLQLSQAADGSTVLALEPSLVETINNLCELLCFQITHHGMFCKNYFLQDPPILKQVALLLKAKDKYLQLGKPCVKVGAVKVFKTCILSNDEFYRKLMVRYDVFGAVLMALLETNGKDNALSSACLVFFEHIRSTPGQKAVITDLVTKYKKYFDALDYTDIFKGLVQKYEHGLESPDNGSISMDITSSAVQKKDGWAKVDVAEEAYFNDSEDDEPARPIVSPKVDSPPLEFVRGKPLVDYDDDDELIGVGRRNTPKMAPAKFNFAIGKTLPAATKEEEAPRQIKKLRVDLE